MGNQFVCAVLSLTQAGLLVSNINIIIDMRVIGGKMALCNSQRHFTPANRQMFDFDHNGEPPLFVQKENALHCPAQRFGRTPEKRFF
jgi:hypothetical protein